MCAGSQVFVFVLEEFVAERTERGRERIKMSVGKGESIVKRQSSVTSE